jgi:uncharacterized protein DUF2809
VPRTQLRRIFLLLLSLAAIVPLGFYSKLAYHGPAAHLVHDSLAGALYEVFWCLALALLLPRWKPARIAAVVLAATCVLEFLQLWHPPLLEWLRSFFIGRAILGSSFDWWDFPWYFAGSALGWAWLRVIAALTPPTR